MFVAVASPAPPPAGPPAIQTISLGGARTDALLERVGELLSPARRAVEAFWGSDPGDVVIIATGSRAEFLRYARLDAAGQWDDIAAVAVADSVDPSMGRATGQRMVLAPGADGMSDDALRIVVTHELFHLAARGGTALDAPRWLTEGVADYVARPPAPVPAAAATDTTLPTDAELDVSGPQRAAGYDRAWWFARFVADDFGVEGLRHLYTAACGPDRQAFPVAVRDVLGVDMAGLQTRWGQWLIRAVSSTR